MSDDSIASLRWWWGPAHCEIPWGVDQAVHICWGSTGHCRKGVNIQVCVPTIDLWIIKLIVVRLSIIASNLFFIKGMQRLACMSFERLLVLFLLVDIIEI